LATTAQLQATFAQAAAPAFPLGGIAAFISILMSRITTLMGQTRGLNEISDTDVDRAKLKGESPQLKRRAILLHRAAYLALLADIATALLLIVMALFTFIGLEHIYGGALLFGIVIVLFILSLLTSRGKSASLSASSISCNSPNA
jgi:hypothetical protein